MGLLSWIVFGLFVGIVANWIMPGPNPGGVIVTILLGVVGAVIGGMVATAFGFRGMNGFDIRSVLVAVGGALLLLFGFRLFAEKAKA